MPLSTLYAHHIAPTVLSAYKVERGNQRAYYSSLLAPTSHHAPGATRVHVLSKCERAIAGRWKINSLTRVIRGCVRLEFDLCGSAVDVS
jgi:hypothetical protein